MSPLNDIFSLGVTYHFILTNGQLPYNPRDNLVLANKQCQFRLNKTVREDQYARSLLESMICPKEYRINIEQVLMHPFLDCLELEERRYQRQHS